MDNAVEPTLPVTGPPAGTSSGTSDGVAARPRPLPLVSASQWQMERARQLIQELSNRKTEALAMYQPLPSQQAFHECNKPERIVVGSNRGGKTLAACVELARAVTGQDPYNKCPKKDGIAILVGFDGKFLAEVLYRKLFRPGAFKMIRDEKTRTWRSFRPWEERDRQREKEAKPAPPLIPARFIQSIAWENRKASVPQVIHLKNGWDLHFISGNAEPPQGWAVDLVYFSEEIGNEEFYVEMAPRLADRKGKFIWDATPQAATDALYRLHERAEDGDPIVAEFKVLLDNNPYIDVQEKKNLYEKWTPEQRLIRYYGEYAKNRYRAYPEFSMHLHGVDCQPIPADWCRYMVVDPGRQVCAVLFAAIPPPDLGDYVYFYDELYIEQCDAEIFGQQVKEKVGADRFRDFIIDWHGSRIHDTASGLNVCQQYSAVLKKHKVSCEVNGHGFTWSNDDIQGGVMAFRAWLRDRGEGQGPRLRVLRERMKAFEKEIKRYHYKREKDGSVSEQLVQRGIHLMDLARYLALYNPRYHKPRPGKKMESSAVRYLKEKQKKARMSGGSTGIRLGPGS